MPFPNEMTQGQGVNQILSRRFGVQGPAAPSVASELFPTCELLSYPENWFLQLERLVGAFDDQPAVAAQRQHVGIWNPAGSGALLVVEQVRIHNASAGTLLYQVAMGLDNGTNTTGQGGDFLDTRLGSTGFLSTGQIWDLSAASVIGREVERVQLAAATQVLVPGPWVLGPGGFVCVRGGVVNMAINTSWRWRERAAAPGELQGAITL